MRDGAPFLASDLAELDGRLLSHASAVVAMEDVHDGHRDPSAIGLRHDVDAADALETAVRIAGWEAERGYRSTYYILHTSPYWGAPGFHDALTRIAELGHEIGIHTNALAEALRTGRDPDVVLSQAIGVLRSYGFPVRGVAGHGDPLCNRDRLPGESSFVNDEQFVECARPKEGAPDRTITRGNVTLKLRPRPLADFGLEYEALRVGLPAPFRISDSGGRWFSPGWEETVRRWHADRVSAEASQLHFLWHSDWWQGAFVREEVAA